MKMIKESDLTHEVFTDYEKEEDILEMFRFESPNGYMIIRRAGDKFNIKVTAEDDFKMIEQLKKVLIPYMKAQVYFTFDTRLELLKDYIGENGLNYWFGMYELSMKKQELYMTVGRIQTYQNEVDTYCRILGKCFEPMRRKHDFKPYDWYGENRDDAIKEFEEATEKKSFYGYVVEKKIVGAAIAINQEIDILGIEPSLQKRGLGRQLLRGVLSDMFEKYDMVKISVVESNLHVLKLYESEGFKLNNHKKMYKNY